MKKIILVLAGIAVFGLAGTAEAVKFVSACKSSSGYDAACIERTITRPSDTFLGTVGYSVRGCTASIMNAADGTFALAEVRNLKKFKTGAPVFASGKDADALSAVRTRYEVEIGDKYARLDTSAVGLSAEEAVEGYLAVCR